MSYAPRSGSIRDAGVMRIRSRAAAVVLAAALALSACGGDDPAVVPSTGSASGTPSAPSAWPAPEPSPTEPATLAAAKTAAQEAFDRWMSGDFAGAYDMYSAAGKKAVTQADYVRYNTTCPPDFARADIVGGRMERPGRAVVRFDVGVGQVSYTVVHEGGRWLLVPSRAAAANWKMGVTAAIKQAKADGVC